jgi:aldose 1-epimerase
MTTAGSEAAPIEGDRLRLRSGDAVLTIDVSAGARFASLVIEGHELLVTHGDRPMEWGCYPMALFAGRIRDGRFSYEGRSFQLETNLPPNAIHGTVLDRPWQVTSAGVDHATLDVDLGRGWPFGGRVDQSIALTPTAVTARLELVADEPMPAWLGWHPWFRRALASGGPVELDFSAARMYRRGDDGLPTGELVDPTPGPWDDAFTDIRRSPRLTWPGVLSLEMESSAPVWVVYDERPHAVCIEPQTAPPDAVNLSGVPLPIAAPGRSISVSMAWRWTSLQGAADRRS